MNYNVDLNYLKEPLFVGLTGSKKSTLLQTVSLIRHMTRFAKAHSCTFYSTKFAHDMGVKPATVSWCIKLLLAKGEIICIKPYQRKGNQPAIYVAERYIPKGAKVYPLGRKGIAPRDKVNNYNNNYKPMNDGIDIPHPFKIEKPSSAPTTPETKLNPLIQEYNNLKNKTQR